MSLNYKVKSLRYELYSKLKVFISFYSAIFFLIIGVLAFCFYFYTKYVDVNTTVLSLKEYSKNINHSVRSIKGYVNTFVKEQDYGETKLTSVISRYFGKQENSNANLFSGVGYASIKNNYNIYNFINSKGQPESESLNKAYETIGGYKNTKWFKKFKNIDSVIYISPQKSKVGLHGQLFLTALIPVKNQNRKNIGLVVIDINIAKKMSEIIKAYKDQNIYNDLGIYLVSTPYFDHNDYQIYDIGNENHAHLTSHLNQSTIEKQLISNSSKFGFDLNYLFYKENLLNGSMTVVFSLNWNIILFVMISYFLVFVLFILLINYLFMKKISKYTDRLSNTITILSENILDTLMQYNYQDKITKDELKNGLVTETISLYKSYRKIRYLINNLKSLSFYRGEEDFASKLQKKIIKNRNNISFEKNNYRVSVEIVSKAANKLSGDIHLVHVKNNRLYILVGDSTGKNITATIHALFCLFSIERIIDKYSSLERITYEINKYICEQNLEDMFLSAIILEIDLEAYSIKYCNAGHDEIILSENNEPRVIEQSDYDIVFGVIPQHNYKVRKIDFDKVINNSFYLYTDGITEANIDGNMLGIASFIELLKKYHSAEEIINKIQTLEENDLSDDKTLIKITIQESYYGKFQNEKEHSN